MPVAYRKSKSYKKVKSKLVDCRYLFSKFEIEFSTFLVPKTIG